MGIINSKTIEKLENEEIPTGSVPTTPILTPRIKELREMDPRSPSTNIIRTPIEAILSKKINKYVDEVTVTECGTPKFVRLSGDPRSPNLEYPRTPLVIPNKKPEDSAQNETPKIISNADKRKSYVLLETNLDYIETDLDTVRHNTSPLKQIEEDQSMGNVNVRKSKELEKEIEELAVEVGAVDIKKNDEVPEITTEVKVIIKQENIESQSDDTEKLAEVTNKEEKSDTVFEEKQDTDKLEAKPKEDVKKNSKENKKDLTVVLENVRDFDKKLTNLIYEDQGVESVQKVIASSQVRNRTPLGMRNEIVNPKKRIPKLKVADKPRKLDTEFSKIPVSKHKKVRNTVQCENTPPRSKLPKSGKVRRQEWDADKTMII